MSTIDIQPRDQVNYYGVLREISRNKKLKNKLLGNADIRPIEDPAYLISMGTMEKLDALEERESYIVDTVMGYMNQNNIQAKREDVCDSLTYNYLKERADVNLDMNVDSYDLILDLLYNIKQAEADNLLMMPIGEHEKKLHEAESYICTVNSKNLCQCLRVWQMRVMLEQCTSWESFILTIFQRIRKIKNWVLAGEEKVQN